MLVSNCFTVGEKEGLPHASLHMTHNIDFVIRNPCRMLFLPCYQYCSLWMFDKITMRILVVSLLVGSPVKVLKYIVFIYRKWKEKKIEVDTVFGKCIIKSLHIVIYLTFPAAFEYNFMYWLCNKKNHKWQTIKRVGRIIFCGCCIRVFVVNALKNPPII